MEGFVGQVGHREQEKKNGVGGGENQRTNCLDESGLGGSDSGHVHNGGYPLQRCEGWRGDGQHHR